jgi:ABC-2 type transport system ATP-binding protein
MTELIEVRELTKYYGEVRGIEDVTMSVGRGEKFGFLGPNGAGKSTLIRVLLGFLKPTSGEARLLGYDVTDRQELVEAKRALGHVPSDVDFYDGLTGDAMLDYFARFRSDQRREELLELFPVPIDRAVDTYSRGNRQKLALVQAFMHDPDLVVMDEPTSGLDPLVQNRFYEFLERERDRGVTIFFSSHNLPEVRRVCSRVGIIRDGQLVALEDIGDLLEKSGKVVRVDVAEPVGLEDFSFPGVVSASVDEQGYLELVLSGGFEELIDRLAPYTIRDLEVRETSLEDAFIHLYDDSTA